MLKNRLYSKLLVLKTCINKFFCWKTPYIPKLLTFKNNFTQKIDLNVKNFIEK